MQPLQNSRSFIAVAKSTASWILRKLNITFTVSSLYSVFISVNPKLLANFIEYAMIWAFSRVTGFNFWLLAIHHQLFSTSVGLFPKATICAGRSKLTTTTLLFIEIMRIFSMAEVLVTFTTFILMGLLITQISPTILRGNVKIYFINQL